MKQLKGARFILSASVTLALSGAVVPVALADEYDDAIAEANTLIEDAKSQKEAAEKQVAELSDENRRLEETLPEKERQRDEAIIGLYKLSQSSGVITAALLGSASFSQFSNLVEYYSDISENDIGTILELGNTAEALEQDMVAAKNSVSEAEEKLSAAHSKLEAAQAAKAEHEEQLRLEELARAEEQRRQAEEAAREAESEDDYDDGDETPSPDDARDVIVEYSGTLPDDGEDKETEKTSENPISTQKNVSSSKASQSNGELLARTFCSLAYSRQVRYSDGYPRTSRYADAYEGIWGAKGDASWKAGKTQGRSCDRGVSTAVVYSGLDDAFPRSCGDRSWGQYAHMSSSSKWLSLGRWSGDEADLEPGDVLIRLKGMAGAEKNHVCMYVGHEIIMDVYENELKGTDADVGKPDASAAWVSSSFANGSERGRAPGMGKDGDTHMFVFRYAG